MSLKLHMNCASEKELFYFLANLPRLTGIKRIFSKGQNHENKNQKKFY
jgi:hypothetical protein